MTKFVDRHLLSKNFREKILEYLQKKSIPHYQLAAKAGISPSYLSVIVNGQMLFAENDKKIKAVAEAIGYKGCCLITDRPVAEAR